MPFRRNLRVLISRSTTVLGLVVRLLGESGGDGGRRAEGSISLLGGVSSGLTCVLADGEDIECCREAKMVYLLELESLSVQGVEVAHHARQASIGSSRVAYAHQVGWDSICAVRDSMVMQRGYMALCEVFVYLEGWTCETWRWIMAEGFRVISHGTNLKRRLAEKFGLRLFTPPLLLLYPSHTHRLHRTPAC